jgi:membrane-bound ClpP family serine protease
VRVEVLGLAASAASIIAMAGDEIVMNRGASLMVHRAWALAVGNESEMREVADVLAGFDASMLEIDRARTGGEADAIKAMLDAETWLGAEAAVEAGFADASDLEVEARAEVSASDVKAIRRVDTALAKQGLPRSERRALLAEIKGGTHDAAPTPRATLDAGAIAEAQRLIRSLKGQ